MLHNRLRGSLLVAQLANTGAWTSFNKLYPSITPGRQMGDLCIISGASATVVIVIGAKAAVTASCQRSFKSRNEREPTGSARSEEVLKFRTEQHVCATKRC